MTDTITSKPFIYDAHACPPFGPDKNLSCLGRYKTAGINHVSINAGYGDMTSAETLKILRRLRHFIESKPEDFLIARHYTDLEELNGRLGITFDLEGANTLSGKLDMLDQYHQLGVRQMLLAYNTNNRAAGGCLSNDSGLTQFGKQIVGRMNELGILADCSHTGIQSTFDIMNASREPVIFSHSNPRALCDHPRNMSDDQIKALADTDGVIGVCGISIFLGNQKPDISTLANHIDYIANLVGIKHVGIGLDYVLEHDEVKQAVKDNPHLFPKDQKFDEVEMIEPELIPTLPEELKKRGYSQQDIEDVMGNNFLRVANEVWR